VADENVHDAGGDVVSGRDLMGNDRASSALEAFKVLHHPKRKAAERLDHQRSARCATMGTRLMTQYGTVL
jgi:hypothetical protein